VFGLTICFLPVTKRIPDANNPELCAHLFFFDFFFFSSSALRKALASVRALSEARLQGSPAGELNRVYSGLACHRRARLPLGQWMLKAHCAVVRCF
jgi:hypothetical protein